MDILLMPWSQFAKGAFAGSSRAVFGLFLAVPHGTRSDPGRVPSIFFTPRGPRVTFNSNLKVTRCPEINKPRIKPINCPAGARRGHGNKFWRKARRAPARVPYGTREGACVVLTRLVGDPVESRRCPYDARTGPGRDPWIISRTIRVNEIRIDQCSINQSINKSWHPPGPARTPAGYL